MMKNKIIMLAPLAGYTNIAYRRFLKPFGIDIVVSEMISDFALIYQNKETDKMIETAEDEQPVAIQLFGGSKEPMLKGLEELQKKANYDYLDINFGCPVNKVVKNNAGSSWLKPERNQELYELCKSIVEKSLKPVTAKIRLGWTEDQINVIDTVKTLEKAGISLITIHGRTRSQMYSGNANYEWIKKAKEAVNIPIIANGDINSLDKAIEVLEYTKCDGIALGRGTLGNPYLVTQIKEYFKTGKRLEDPTISMQMNYLKTHYEMLKDLKGEYVATQEIRGIGTHYFKGFAFVKDYKIRLSQIKSPEEFYKIIEDVLKDDLIHRI